MVITVSTMFQHRVGINDPVCEFCKVTLVALVCGFSKVPFFIIKLDYVIAYFSFYHIVKKNSFRKKKHVIKF